MLSEVLRSMLSDALDLSRISIERFCISWMSHSIRKVYSRAISYICTTSLGLVTGLLFYFICDLIKMSPKSVILFKPTQYISYVCFVGQTKKSAKSIFQEFTLEHVLCNFYRLFLFQRDSFFANNTSKEFNRISTEVNMICMPEKSNQ